MVACLDIGGTSIKLGVLDENGKIYERDLLRVSEDVNGFIESIVYCIEKYRKVFEIEGIAISSPGAVNREVGIIGGTSAIPYIHGPNWKKIFSEKFNLKVSIENDANCVAIAEVFNGSAKNVDDMMFIVCGTGIGGSIVHKGEIHRGKNLHGGEFGYMLMEEDNGKFRTLSEVGSTMSMVRKIRSIYDDSWTGEKIFDAAENGNEICKEVIDRFYLNLAKGIFNLQYVYDPDLILLGGAISEREDFIDKKKKKLDYLMNKVEDAKIRPIINTCMHKKDANLIGALSNFLKEHVR